MKRSLCRNGSIPAGAGMKQRAIRRTSAGPPEADTSARLDPLRHSDRFISRCKPWYAVVEGGAMKRTPVSTQEGARDHETAVAPEPVHPRPRTSRGVVAPSGFVADAVD